MYVDQLFSRRQRAHNYCTKSIANYTAMCWHAVVLLLCAVLPCVRAVMAAASLGWRFGRNRLSFARQL